VEGLHADLGLLYLSRSEALAVTIPVFEVFSDYI